MTGSWRTAMIRGDLLVRVKAIVESNAAKNQGVTNISQFIDLAIRDKIKEFKIASLSHISTYEDHVKILDLMLGEHGRIVSVDFNNDGSPYCDYCEAPDCVHVQFAWEIPKARDILYGHGFAPPPSKP